MLHLIGHGSQLKRMLKLKNTPGLTRGDLVGSILEYFSA
jgi:hypothetical protein